MKKTRRKSKSTKDQLIWMAVGAGAVAIGLGQILAKRGAAIGWRAYTGKLPPG